MMPIVFFFQLLAANAAFAYRLKRRSRFWLRILISCVVIMIVGGGYASLQDAIYSAQVPEDIPLFIYSTRFYVWAILFIAGIYVCFDVSIKKAIMYGSAGYASQNCAYLIRRTIYVYTTVFSSGWSYHLSILLIDGILYTLLGVANYFIGIKDEEVELPYWLVIVDFVIIALTSVFMSLHIPFGREYVINYVYGICLNLFLIFIQLFVIRFTHNRKQIAIFDSLLRAEKQQHELTQETVETINRKCHDIKHHVAVLYTLAMKQEDSKIFQEERLKEIQDSISIYENAVKTGNEILDIIIMEKGLRCERHGIDFSYIIDGKQLAFMDSLDVSCLFSNALDNAIECECSEEGKRFIFMNVSMKKSFLGIHIENACTKVPKFENELPVTTKDDKAFHGYGTKSIKMTVDKYGGTTTMFVENGVFCLDIMFPIMPQSAEISDVKSRDE